MLDADIVALLDGTDLQAAVGFTLELITVDEDGWPRVSLLSAGEVLAAAADTLRIALWPGSHSTANLERTARAVIAFVHGGAAHRIGLQVRRDPDVLVTGEPRAAFVARVVSMRHDEVPYARLRSGITYELAEPDGVLARWHATLEAIR